MRSLIVPSLASSALLKASSSTSSVIVGTLGRRINGLRDDRGCAETGDDVGLCRLGDEAIRGGLRDGEDPGELLGEDEVDEEDADSRR